MALERDEVPVVLLFLCGRALALVTQQRQASDAQGAARNKIEQREGPEGVRGRQDLAFVGANHFSMLLTALTASGGCFLVLIPAALKGRVGLSAAPNERLTGNNLATGRADSG